MKYIKYICEVMFVLFILLLSIYRNMEFNKKQIEEKTAILNKDTAIINIIEETRSQFAYVEERFDSLLLQLGVIEKSVFETTESINLHTKMQERWNRSLFISINKE